MFVSFPKHESHYCYVRLDQEFGKFIAFPAKTTIFNSQYNICSIKLRAIDYLHAAHFRSVTYNIIKHCLVNVLQLLCTNSVFFHQPNIKTYRVHVCLVLKTCLLASLLDEVGP